MRQFRSLTFCLLWLVVTVRLPPLSAQGGARDSVRPDNGQLDRLEDSLRKNPYYLAFINRGQATTLLGAELVTRPARMEWGTLVTMVCGVDGAQRRQLTGQARVAAYQGTLTCERGFYQPAAEARRAFPDAREPHLGFDDLQLSMAEAAVESGDLAEASRLASALLRQRDTAWVNDGRVVHDANQVLGRAALREGRLADAKGFLLAAGKTPGGQGLAGYGPQFFLARELLERGERDVVLEYLEMVSHPAHDTYSRLHDFAKWKDEIRQGKIPDSVEWH